MFFTTGETGVTFARRLAGGGGVLGADLAVRAVVLDGRAGPLEPQSLDVDRPFIYLIRDRATGAILFLGRLVDPTAQ